MGHGLLPGYFASVAAVPKGRFYRGKIEGIKNQ